MAQKLRILLFLLPLIIGGFIYIIFRTETLLMFRWFKFLNLDNEINIIQNLRNIYFFPNWFIYNFPDGLWIFSYTALSLEIWRHSLNKQNVFWVLCIPFVAILSEFLQFFKIISGTFDFIDIIFYLIGVILPFYILKPFFNNKNYETF